MSSDTFGGVIAVGFLILLICMMGNIVGCRSDFEAEAIRNQAATMTCDVETGLCEFTWNEATDD